LTAATLAAAPAAAVAARLTALFGEGFLGLHVLLFVGIAFAVVVEPAFEVAVFDDRHLVVFRGVDFLDAIVAGKVGVLVLLFLGSAQGGLFLGVRLLLGEQRLAILFRNLVVVGVDFAEREEPVAIAAEVDEGRLKRRFDPRALG